VHWQYPRSHGIHVNDHQATDPTRKSLDKHRSPWCVRQRIRKRKDR
jgi:hypothetical protein